MSKGRLEEIRKNVLTSEFDLFGNTYISMPKENFDWLIKRIELLGKLREEDSTYYNVLLTKIREQNERYKQVLELIYKDTFYESEHDLVSPLHVIRKRAEKVLEGE